MGTFWEMVGMTAVIESVLTFVPVSVMRDAFTATLLSAGREATLPVLESVQLRRQGKTLVLCSTDRYRLTRVTVTLDAGDVETPDWVFLISSDDAKAILSALPKVTRHGLFAPVTLTVEDGSLTVDTGQAVLRLRERDGDYPKVDNLIPSETSEFGEVAIVGLNPKYLTDLAKMPGRAKDAAVRLRFAGKKVVSEWSNDDATYVHMIMSVRSE